ncbi:uncharacterized protein LOC126843986 [Adelges cooleyi]|uniref:uncharacterized protein LOC126843986 n=1 Tax=Adelges cooleyi TaxID=133065 RepID=UPI00217F6D7D|nr:uncharacterized protein LOC126843986 [Adelges cooleyi]XP_050437778.1 uncharacterized protein LOC126843986 [Adelges cooleyi]XP_050437779.1 uncharacterized protein LOC126843986 [Adelges cooleyi]XP_050437781.1 uncharacterized protein LOC126843986 [Adelges cooleyi]
MDDFNRGIVIKIEEEDEDTTEQFTAENIDGDEYRLNEIGDETRIKNKECETDDNHYKSTFDVVENSEQQKTNNGNAYNAGEMCNETMVKVEVDLVNGLYFESVIEVEKNSLMDEIQSFVCDVCKKLFSSKKKVADTLHIHIVHNY